MIQQPSSKKHIYNFIQYVANNSAMHAILSKQNNSYEILKKLPAQSSLSPND